MGEVDIGETIKSNIDYWKNLYLKENEKYLIKMTDEQYTKVIELVECDINKKWQDKIKAKIEEIDEVLKGQLIEKIRVYFEAQKEVLQSLLKEE